MDTLNNILDTPDQTLTQDPPDFHLASGNQRFVNLIVDTVGAYVSLAIFAIVLFSAFPALAEGIEEDNPLATVFSWLWWVVYYSFQEYFFGRTLGKLVTGTFVVTQDGQRADFPTILGRSFSRLVPFEAFSFLNSSVGWHDKWSKTRVVQRSFYNQV
jgi:uncharacterized RDD family membrane protein YckC